MQSVLAQALAANSEVSARLQHSLAGALDSAAAVMAQSFLGEGKLLCAGASSIAAIAEYCAAIFAHRLSNERPGLPCLALSCNSSLLQAINDDRAHQEVYAQQIRALGQATDCLLLLSGTAGEAVLIQAISAAHDRQMHIIALTGSDSIDLAALLTPDDIEVPLSIAHPARLAEAQLLVVHCLCEMVEYRLFGLGDHE